MSILLIILLWLFLGWVVNKKMQSTEIAEFITWYALAPAVHFIQLLFFGITCYWQKWTL